MWEKEEVSTLPLLFDAMVRKKCTVEIWRSLVLHFEVHLEVVKCQL